MRAGPAPTIEELLAELEERKQRAWADYTVSLRGLEGRAYEEAESESWQHLEEELEEVAAERDRLVDGSA